MNTSNDQSLEPEKFKAYIRTITHKWVKVEIPSQVNDDLLKSSETLKKMLSHLTVFLIKSGAVGEEDGINECENQLKQLVFTSFFLDRNQRRWVKPIHLLRLRS